MTRRFPTTYFGNILYHQLLLDCDKIEIDTAEHFVKQTYRNRTEIFGANGRLKLIVPLEKWKNNTPVHEIKVAYNHDWQKQHWRSIQSAYRSSPYFEFYEDQLKPIFTENRFEYLIELNDQCLGVVLKILLKETKYTYSKEYGGEFERAINSAIRPNHRLKSSFKEYIQVFSNRLGFLPNLSILDLIFNMGPESVSYLKSQK